MFPGEQWDNCPPGLIGSMVERQRRGRHLAKLARVGGAAALAILLLIGVTTSARFSNTVGAEISCPQAVQLFAQYRSDQLDFVTHQKVMQHLQDCPHCRSRYRQSDSPEAQSPTRRHASLVVALHGI